MGAVWVLRVPPPPFPSLTHSLHLQPQQTPFFNRFAASSMKLNLANVLDCQSTYFRHLLMKFAWVVGALGEALGFLLLPADSSGCGLLLESRPRCVAAAAVAF